MFRILKHYGASAPYDGIPDGDASRLALDPVECAGTVKSLNILCTGRARGLVFIEALANILQLSLFMALLLAPIGEPEKQNTSRKWKHHFDVLQECHLIEPSSTGEIKFYAKYFAVEKPGTPPKARAIVNLKLFSKLCVTPNSTNLPEIHQVLNMFTHGRFFVVGDFRHFFHQFGVLKSVSNYFGLICGSKVMRWTCLPMGWSHSPRIAQCAAWVTLMEAAFRAKLAKAEDFQNLHNPPNYMSIRGGTITVWYDNILGSFTDAISRDLFYTKLKEVCSEDQFNIQIKHLDIFSHRKMMDRDGQDAESRVHLPKYLGMELSAQKRDRDGQSVIQWRHDPEKVHRWADMKDLHERSTSRSIARAVGIILWDATISNRSLCYEDVAIKHLQEASKRVREHSSNKRNVQPWDVEQTIPWPISTIAYLKDRVGHIRERNPWRTVEGFETSDTVRAASDASGDSNSNDPHMRELKPGGWGFVVWDKTKMTTVFSHVFPAKKWENTHIYIREMYACKEAIEHICTKNKSVHILLGVDNSAVVGAVRARYSSNHHANEMIQRIEEILTTSGCTLEIVPLRSEDNPADGPSRSKAVDYAAITKCDGIMDRFCRGLGRTEKTVRPGPSCDGNLRHDDAPVDDIDLLVAGINLFDDDGMDEDNE